MSSTPHSAIDLNLRSYAEIGAPNRHDFVQLVFCDNEQSFDRGHLDFL